MPRAVSGKSNIIYGSTGKFKLDICGITRRSCIVHTNTMKTDIATVVADFTPVLFNFECEAGDLFYRDRKKHIELTNAEPIASSLVQDGDTNEIETHEDGLQSQFSALSSVVVAVGGFK